MSNLILPPAWSGSTSCLVRFYFLCLDSQEKTAETDASGVSAEKIQDEEDEEEDSKLQEAEEDADEEEDEDEFDSSDEEILTKSGESSSQHT